MTNTNEWRTLDDLDPSALYVLPLGIGNAFTDRYFHSSLLVIAGGELLLIDAPAPLRRVIREASHRARIAFDTTFIDKVFLTHLHGDHCNGIEELGFVKKYLDQGRQAHLFLLEELVEPLWESRLKAAMGGRNRQTGEPKTIDDFFEVHPVVPGVPYPIAEGKPISIEVYRTRHSVPTAALRVRFGRASFGYSADTPYDEGLLRFLDRSDFIVHEASRNDSAEVHTPLELLESLPEDMRSRMHLIHVPDDLTQDETSIPILEVGRLYEILPRVRANSSSEVSGA